ncbi:MAG: hypothetical protein ABF242_00125 [Flavobacteriales bacterium]
MNAIKKHLSQDEILKRVINSSGMMEFQSTNNVFNDLMSCVLEQQIHYRSAKQIFQRMLAKAELTELNLANFAQFEEFGMRDYKISMKKLESMNAVVTYFEQNSHNWAQLEDHEIRTILSSIQGIGDWTIDMILLFTLGRPNIFPWGDFHLKNCMTELYDIKSRYKANMNEIAELWQPFSSVATLFLLEFKKKKLKLPSS